MKSLRITLAIAAAIGLSACTNGDLVSRAVAPTTALLSEKAEQPQQLVSPSYNVVAVNVVAPTTLKVSEGNTYYPNADIVWREDNPGNRYEQVSGLIENAFQLGVSGIEGDRGVILNVQVVRFHALTERARFTVGGTHDIHFILTVLDAETTQVIEPARLIETSLTALGGMAGMVAASRGQTQRVRITAHLVDFIRLELARPRVIADIAPVI